MNRLHESKTRHPIRVTKLAGLSAATACLIAGCSSSSGGGTSPTSTPSAPVTSSTTITPATSESASTSPASTSRTSTSSALAAAPGPDLSGKWKGDYGGVYSGTFSLTWTQSGSTLTGSITLSKPATTLRLTGTLKGNAITFGTVGSAAITYTGTVVAGSVMSGSYTVNGSGGGKWGSTKSR